jgi:hypothetical protein
MVSNKMIVTIMLIAAATLVCTGCSDDSAVTPTTVIDTAPPAVPANLSVDHSDDSATINWDANTVDTDLAGYIVTRERYGVTEVLVSIPVSEESEESYVDTNPRAGSTLYHVYAVDQAGNMSAVATVSLTIVRNHQTADLKN